MQMNDINSPKLTKLEFATTDNDCSNLDTYILYLYINVCLKLCNNLDHLTLKNLHFIYNRKRI